MRVCHICKETLPGTGNCVKRCKDCNSPFKVNDNTHRCPSCSKEKSIFTCELCNNNYQYIGRNLPRYTNTGIKVCPICKDTLSGIGDRVVRCKDCHTPFKGASNSVNCCPSCDEKRRTFICELCSSNYQYTGKQIGQYTKENIKVCPKCEATLLGDGSKTLRCKTCNTPFKATAGATNYCPSCSQKRRTFTCELCNNNYQYTGDKLDRYTKGNVKVCPECKAILPGEGGYLLRCKSCNSPFKALGNKTNCCPSCNRMESSDIDKTSSESKRNSGDSTTSSATNDNINSC